MRQNRMGLSAAIVAAQMAGVMVAVRDERNEAIRLSIDPSGPEDDVTTIVVTDRDGAAERARTVLSEPITTNRNLADLEAIRTAQARQARKIARQAKGFR